MALLLLNRQTPVTDGSLLPATTTAAAVSATAGAGCFRLGFVDGQLAAFQVLAVPGVDNGLRLGVVGHLGEGEPARASRVAVGDDVKVLARATGVFQGGAEGVFIQIEGEVADVESISHLELLFFPWSAFGDPSNGEVF